MDRNRVLSTAAGVLLGLFVYTLVISLIDSRYLALPVKTRIEKGLSDAADAERERREAADEAEREADEAEEAGATLYERYNSVIQCVNEEGEDMTEECERSFEAEERSTP